MPVPTDTVLHTPRLVMRGARPDDLDDLNMVYSDPETMRYWSSPPHANRSVTQAMLGRHMAAAAAGLTYFVIERDGHAIGTGGMHKPYEIGFILHAAHWRQGIMAEAMGEIIAHLWQVTDAPALTADADPRNAPSVALLQSLGFAITHTARNTYQIDGEWSDSVYLCLPRPGVIPAG